MDYSSAISKALPGTFVPDIGDETPKTSAIPGVGAAPLAGSAPAAGQTGSNEKSFIDTLKDVASDVNTKMNTAIQAEQDLATGKTNDLEHVVASVEEANLAFQFALSMRTKLLNAYQQVSQMQV